MISSGYSQTPLAKKLGIRGNFKIKLINVPAYYPSLFTDWPENVTVATDTESKKDFIHYFAVEADALEKEMSSLKSELVPAGILWISWYKKTAKMRTDITEDIIRDIALRNGLVDVKVCAIDEVWSGLKLVIPVKDRVFLT